MIRHFHITDTEQVLLLLRLNTPQYFDPSEESDLLDYLRHSIEDYFVVEENGRIVGCGGINYFEEKTVARISWDIIHPDFQGKGIGRKLTQHRISKIKHTTTVKQIVVRTTQLTHRFYEKLGFKLEKTERDFWAKGFDLYQMNLTLGA
jgi:N-acetylglutamate synthase-like GNAT family acetyltransferase